MDTSTLNGAQLERLRAYKLPPTYSLGDPGSGCAGEPPGHPSYFLQPVYTQHGNTPSRGPEYVIAWKNTLRVVCQSYSADWRDSLQRLYLPLPIDHPRVRLWMAHTYRHFKGCYHDATAEKETDRTLIYPVPYYKLKTFRDDARFSDDWREKEQAAIAQANAEIRSHALQIATINNHKAVRAIRRYYPDHEPILAWIENPPQIRQADWWNREATRPEVSACQGRGSGFWGHYEEGYCAWCGRENGVVADGSEVIL